MYPPPQLDLTQFHLIGSLKSFYKINILDYPKSIPLCPTWINSIHKEQNNNSNNKINNNRNKNGKDEIESNENHQ